MISKRNPGVVLQLDLIRSEKSEISHPYNWAGFALYGDWR